MQAYQLRDANIEANVLHVLDLVVELIEDVAINWEHAEQTLSFLSNCASISVTQRRWLTERTVFPKLVDAFLQ